MSRARQRLRNAAKRKPRFGFASQEMALFEALKVERPAIETDWMELAATRTSSAGIAGLLAAGNELQ